MEMTASERIATTDDTENTEFLLMFRSFGAL